MRPRTFLYHAARGITAATLASHSAAQRLLAIPALDKKFSAADRVTLGNTGITTSRLAMGTVGSGHHSNQTALGINGLSRLLRHHQAKRRQNS
jgi:hypothetical protein